jgi:hypothetical protein
MITTDSHDSQYASWSEQLRSLVQTSIHYVQAERKGLETDDIVNERLSICESCDQYDSVHKRCKRCGCFMKLKTKIPSATCPLGLW